jgi:hypothetical protein
MFSEVAGVSGEAQMMAVVHQAVAALHGELVGDRMLTSSLEQSAVRARILNAYSALISEISDLNTPIRTIDTTGMAISVSPWPK